MGDDIPKNMQQSITGFTIAKEDIYRKIDVPKKNYDLMSRCFSYGWDMAKQMNV